MAGNHEGVGPSLKDLGVEIPEPKVEVIAETRKRKSRPRFDEQPSPVEGVTFYVERGGHVDFNRRQTRQIQADSDRIARAKKYDVVGKAARKRQLERKEAQPDFAGNNSERGNYKSSFYPKETRVRYSPALLRSSTGEFYPEIVREEGQLVLTFPARPGVDVREELSRFAELVAAQMIEEGREPAEVGTLITPTVVQRLDEERLNGLIADGKVRLRPGTRTATEVWEFPTDPLHPDIKPKPQKLK